MAALSNTMIVLRDANQIKITDAAHVAAVFRDLLALEDAIARDTEHYFAMHLDVRHTVKLVELVSIGVLDSARVHPRETFRRAIVEGSASIIVAHNHPSGTVTPSDDDIRVTETLHQAGQILDIPLIDHIVFTSNKYFSFRANAARRDKRLSQTRACWGTSVSRAESIPRRHMLYY